VKNFKKFSKITLRYIFRLRVYKGYFQAKNRLHASKNLENAFLKIKKIFHQKTQKYGFFAYPVLLPENGDWSRKTFSCKKEHRAGPKFTSLHESKKQIGNWRDRGILKNKERRKKEQSQS
jgi:hypothetical protein